MNYNVEHIISGLFGGAIIFGIIILLLFLPLIIVGIIAYWKLFQKAGKPGWYSIIPFYSNWVLVEIAGLNWWWFLLMIVNVAFSFEMDGLSFAISICGFLASFNCFYNISKKFNKDNTFSIFAGIFNFIFVLILGLSKKEVYDNNIIVSPNGIFGQPDSNNNVNNNNNNNNNTHTENDDSNSNENVSYCGNCGTKLNVDAKFCPNCGTEKK